MDIVAFAAKPGGGNDRTIVVRIRIEFKFVDVFDEERVEIVYFVGIAGQNPGAAITHWNVEMTPEPSLLDWDGPSNYDEQ